MVKQVPPLSDQGFGNTASSLDNSGGTRGRGSALVPYMNGAQVEMLGGRHPTRGGVP